MALCPLSRQPWGALSTTRRDEDELRQSFWVVREEVSLLEMKHLRGEKREVALKRCLGSSVAFHRRRSCCGSFSRCGNCARHPLKHLPELITCFLNHINARKSETDAGTQLGQRGRSYICSIPSAPRGSTPRSSSSKDKAPLEQLHPGRANPSTGKTQKQTECLTSTDTVGSPGKTADKIQSSQLTRRLWSRFLGDTLSLRRVLGASV